MEFIKETIVANFWKQISNHAHDYAIWPIAKKAVRKLDREMLYGVPREEVVSGNKKHFS
jgi:hypothetical protein